MRIAPFVVEQWMNEFETRCSHNLAEKCVASLKVSELLDLAGVGASALADLLPLKLTYGAIEGSDRLRGAIRLLAAFGEFAGIVNKDADEDGRDQRDWLRAPDMTAHVTREQLRDAARLYLRRESYVRFTLLPETAAPPRPTPEP